MECVQDHHVRDHRAAKLQIEGSHEHHPTLMSTFVSKQQAMLKV